MQDTDTVPTALKVYVQPQQQSFLTNMQATIHICGWEGRVKTLKINQFSLDQNFTYLSLYEVTAKRTKSKL